MVIRRSNNKLIHILVDVLGVVIIISSPLIGWLPGPGGIFVFLAGLSLLATNHEWARRWLHRLRDKSANIFELVFTDNKVVRNLLDLAMVVFLWLSWLLWTTQTNAVFKSLAISCLFLAIIILWQNRTRGQRLSRLVKIKLKH